MLVNNCFWSAAGNSMFERVKAGVESSMYLFLNILTQKEHRQAQWKQEAELNTWFPLVTKDKQAESEESKHLDKINSNLIFVSIKRNKRSSMCELVGGNDKELLEIASKIGYSEKSKYTGKLLCKKDYYFNLIFFSYEKVFPD